MTLQVAILEIPPMKLVAPDSWIISNHSILLLVVENNPFSFSNSNFITILRVYKTYPDILLYLLVYFFNCVFFYLNFKSFKSFKFCFFGKSN